jgi:hypothetical protein
MRRFLVSYQYDTQAGFGFGSIYHERPDNKLPGPQSIVRLREDVAAAIGITKGEVVILAISEVSAEGKVVT